jgi:hypothetical protein
VLTNHTSDKGVPTPTARGVTGKPGGVIAIAERGEVQNDS